MPRIRTIKPEFFKDEKLYDAERESGLPLRIAYAGLWTQADREGRFEWRSRQLATDILPYDSADFSRVLDELATRGFLEKYSQSGVTYGRIRSFSKHQTVNNREKPSTLPPSPEELGTNSPNPTKTEESTREARVADACPTREPNENHACPTPLCNYRVERKGKEGKGREESRVDDASSSSSSSPPSTAAPPPTPADITRQFFESFRENGPLAAKVFDWLLAQNVPREVATVELGKFVDYWTEPTKSGRRQRWETEPTFELRRRIATWFRNFEKWGRVGNSAADDAKDSLTLADL